MNKDKVFIIHENQFTNFGISIPSGMTAEDMLMGQMKWWPKGRYVVLQCIGEYDVEVAPSRQVTVATHD